jgi:hypothetical protein
MIHEDITPVLLSAFTPPLHTRLDAPSNVSTLSRDLTFDAGVPHSERPRYSRFHRNPSLPHHAISVDCGLGPEICLRTAKVELWRRCAMGLHRTWKVWPRHDMHEPLPMQPWREQSTQGGDKNDPGLTRLASLQRTISLNQHAILAIQTTGHRSRPRLGEPKAPHLLLR